MLFFLVGSNDFTCPLAFLYLIQTDCILFFPHFFFVQLIWYLRQNKQRPLNYGGGGRKKKRWEWRDRALIGGGNLVSAWTSSLRMNLLPGDSCPSPGQLPAGGTADVWAEYGQCVCNWIQRGIKYARGDQERWKDMGGGWIIQRAGGLREETKAC